MKYGDVPRIAWLASDANPDPVTRAQYRELAARPFEPPDASATPAPYPSAVAQVVGVTKAAVRFAASGCATVDRVEYDRRRAVCRTCPHLDPAADRCRKCGCALALKPWAASERCPEGKW